MTVEITWRDADDGDPITDKLDHGSVNNGAESTGKIIWIRHNKDNPLTDVALYIRQCSSTYSGNFSALSDFMELLSWGDADEADDFGGFLINFLAEPDSAFPIEGWATVAEKFPLGPDGIQCGGFVHCTGTGDSADNAVLLPTTTYASAEGVLQNGITNVRFKTKVIIPTNEKDIGYRQWDQILRFNYTT
jgi:hypothetical protein